MYAATSCCNLATISCDSQNQTAISMGYHAKPTRHAKAVPPTPVHLNCLSMPPIAHSVCIQCLSPLPESQYNSPTSRNGRDRFQKVSSFPGSLTAAANNPDFIGLDACILQLECHILDEEGPHVVAKAVGIKMALPGKAVSRSSPAVGDRQQIP